MLDYPALFALIASISGIVGTAVAISRSLDARFGKLRSQLTSDSAELAAQLAEIRRELGIQDTRDLNKLEALDYKVNSNRQLIEHRTQRFTSELSRAVELLQGQINEIKGFLDKTTDFVIRGNRGESS